MAQQRGRRSGGPRDAAARDAQASSAGRSVPARSRPPAPSAQHRERLRAVVEPVVVDAGFDLEDLTVSRVGRRHLVRIAVDSDTGVNLDAVAELSRKISARLDEVEATGDELIAGEYELEVGSPGIDRPVIEPRHWRRNRTRLVKVTAGGRELTGRVTAVDGSGVTLDVDGSAQTWAFGDLGPGRVQVELKRLAELPDHDLDAADHDDAADDDDFDDDEEGEDEA